MTGITAVSAKGERQKNCRSIRRLKRTERYFLVPILKEDV
jgi:hypothetical protein